MTAPPYVIAVVICLLNAWHADKTGERYWHIVCPPVLAMAMYIIAVSTTGFAARYFAMCLMVGGTYAGYVVALGYISNSTYLQAEGSYSYSERTQAAASATC